MLKNKWIYLIVVVVAVAALAGALFWYFSSDQNDYVAKVGDVKITTAEYQIILHTVKSQLEQYALGNTPDPTAVKDFWAGKLGDQSAETYAKNLALDNAKDFKIRLLKAKQLNYSIDKATLDKLNSDLDKQIQSFGTTAEASIKDRYGVSVKDYRAFIVDFTLAYTVLTDKETKKITTTDAEIKKYYDDNKSKLENVTVRHILFSTSDATGKAIPAAQQAEVKKTATDIMNKIKSGSDMAALAKKYSADPGSKDNGGLLSPFGRGAMVKPFEDWAFSAKVGDIGLVKSDYGYHVMRLEGKKSTYDELKDTAKTALINKKFSDIIAAWGKEKQFAFTKNQKVLDSIKVNG